MNERGPFFYLHANGDLIYKSQAEERDFLESPFALAYWPVDTLNRANAWSILVEAGAMGATPEALQRLQAAWSCDDGDGLVFAGLCGLQLQINHSRGQCICDIPGAVGAVVSGNSVLSALVELARFLGTRSAKSPEYKPFPEMCRAAAERNPQ